MGNKQEKGFDLPCLLRLGLLDIRKIAQSNLFLTVGEYFALLYRYKFDAPDAAKAIDKIACLNSDVSTLLTVQGIKELLEEIGCKKFILILSDIIGALKKDNFDLAADCARSILEEFNDVYKKIMEAEITGSDKGDDQPEYFTLDDETHVIQTTPLTAQTLKKFVDKLDRDEESRKLRILAIDDSAASLKAVSAALSADYKVYGMTNPNMIEKFLQEITPELFLLDYKMPERSGFELIPIIRNFEEHKTTPIIIMTSMGSVDHISASLSLGACDFIVKPFQEDILRKKIAKHIVKKKLL